jgi:hypothetical protein
MADETPPRSAFGRFVAVLQRPLFEPKRARKVHWLKKVVGFVLLATFALSSAFALSPVSSRTSRLAGIVAAVVFITGILFVSWSKRPIRWSVLGLLGAAALFVSWPGGEVPAAALRWENRGFLRSDLDVPYVWGGESHRGIDCSGLVRRGLINALLNRGLLHGERACLRLALSLWWNDCTARELAEGYGGRTVPILETPSLNRLDHSTLQPGDMAVTTSGLHVMGYLGDRVWIEADPMLERVIVAPIPSEQVGWCDTPMKIVRWRILDEARW